MANIAFPTAYGAGAFTTGGRGFGAYHVINLNDSGIGSFRQAVSDANSNGGGNIVFDISGVITLNSNIGLTSNLTIAGQTAPEGGITFDGDRFYVANVDNLIVRHIRFKGGEDVNNDSVTVRENVTNHIWDHCSFGFGGDEGASWYETQSGYTVENISIQRCLFGENSKGSIVGGLTGSTTVGDISFNQNLCYNSSHRFPNTSGNNCNVEVINNVVWGVGSRLVRVNGVNQNLNHINNYSDFGTRGINDDRVNMFSYESGYPNIFTEGNKIVAQSQSSPLTSNVSQMNLDSKLSWKHFINGTSTPQGSRDKGDQLESNYFSNTQHPLLGNPINIITADETLLDLINDSGCNARLNADGSISGNLDTLDADALSQVSQGNYVDKLNSSQYIVPPITSVSRPSSFYNTSKSVNIPELWFDSNVPNGMIDSDISPNGYSYLELYLNQVDGTVNVLPETGNITHPLTDKEIADSVRTIVKFAKMLLK